MRNMEAFTLALEKLMRAKLELVAQKFKSVDMTATQQEHQLSNKID